MTDKITESLRKSSEKLAKAIAIRTTEQQALEKQLNDLENELTMLQAKADIHKDTRDRFHGDLKERKDKKGELFEIRDGLITQKRDLQTLHNESSRTDPELESRIEQISERIGRIIEQGKEFQEQMDELYQLGNREHEAMLETIEVIKEKRLKFDDRKEYLEKKLVEIDQDLREMRRNMQTIQDRLPKT
ncbi:MAG: hypothetical protein ACXAE3_14485 [Candidatus Kariarchaeaceae archaeon]|jgi:chromosome segregation ATPase